MKASSFHPVCFLCVCMCVYLYWAPQHTSGVPSVIRPVPMKVGSNIPEQTSGVISVIRVFVFSYVVYVVFDLTLLPLPLTYSFCFEVSLFLCLFLILCHLIQFSQDFHMSDLLKLIPLFLLGKDTFVLLVISFSCKSFDNILFMLERWRVLPLDVVFCLLHQVL